MRKPAILAAMVFATFVTAAAQTPQIQINKDNRTITITTSSDATAEAEIATVHIGFISYGADEQSAYAAGSQRSNAIFDALTSAGVAKKDIESMDQGVAPVQPYENNTLPEKQKAERKFQVTQSWTAKCPAAEAAKILHVAVEAGANNSGGIDWSVKDEDALQSQAAAKALKSARTVASAMAEGLGVKLGPLVYASNEAPQSEPRPRPMFARAKAAAAEVQPLAITPRKVEKSATVTAVFAIE